MPPSSVHFNGSVNLPDAETVMREISSRIPTGVRRMTDGETGERGYWILFQIEKFLAMPELESVGSGEAYDTGAEDAPAMPQLRLADGVSAEVVQWPNLGYADEYRQSFELFRALQEDGTIPAGVVFQMQYPTPLASMAGTIVPEDLPSVAASYEAALFADLDQALATIPHDRCAVQWDVAVEFGLLEGGFGPEAHMALAEITPGLTRCVDRVPADVPVGMHLCYGDYGHQHFTQPESLAVQVQVVNAVVAAARRRPVNWVSFTVPQARSDEDYFAPLHDLAAGPETELYFALVPYHPAAARHHRRAGEANRRLAGRVASRSSRLGDLHRMRDGTSRGRRCTAAARPAPRDPRRPQLTSDQLVGSVPDFSLAIMSSVSSRYTVPSGSSNTGTYFCPLSLTTSARDFSLLPNPCFTTSYSTPCSSSAFCSRQQASASTCKNVYEHRCSFILAITATVLDRRVPRSPIWPPPNMTRTGGRCRSRDSAAR